jgi:hypothetical protein
MPGVLITQLPFPSGAGHHVTRAEVRQHLANTSLPLGTGASLALLLQVNVHLRKKTFVACRYTFIVSVRLPAPMTMTVSPLSLIIHSRV